MFSETPLKVTIAVAGVPKGAMRSYRSLGATRGFLGSSNSFTNCMLAYKPKNCLQHCCQPLLLQTAFLSLVELLFIQLLLSTLC
jgi:hypothetical protein